jgi:oxygen-independent coproporphyrinogen-3 oxidase
MSNLYFHYPFCKQACHYCNFHFSTKTKESERLWKAMLTELKLRRQELQLPLESLYFGGGSPSLLSPNKLEALLNLLNKEYNVGSDIEITLEVNPDDVTKDYLTTLKSVGINRISLGLQSFYDRDLKLMNRVHSSDQALKALEFTSGLFSNFSLDLIYGMPHSTLLEWEQNLKTVMDYDPPHLSAYALTVEEATVLDRQVKKGEIILLPEEGVQEQYELLLEKTEKGGFINYEFSNFGKPNYFSINNQNYWQGKPYLGIGPGAHSYDGHALRKWNISNNPLYIKAIEGKELPLKEENLSTKDRYNEYIMTGLRTIYGVSVAHIKNTFGTRYVQYLEEQAARHFPDHNLYWDGDCLKVTKKAKFLTDGLAADLFFI